MSAAALERIEFRASDPDEVARVLGASFASLRVEPVADPPFSFVQTVTSDGTVAVSTLAIDGRLASSSLGTPDVLFTDIGSGRYSWRSRGVSGDQEQPLILPARHELSVEIDTVRSVMVTVDALLTARWLSRWTGLTPGPAPLDAATAGSASVRHAVRLYGQVAETDAFQSELVRASLLDVLMSTTAHHLLPEAPLRSDAAPAALLRAEEHLRAHAHEAVSILDAAEAARLSMRGLHAQFRRWRDVTPAQYLRAVRLDRVRADLVAARESGGPERVADVARRWGFGHLGRFAHAYLEAFGEHPSTTLRGTG